MIAPPSDVVVTDRDRTNQSMPSSLASETDTSTAEEVEQRHC